MYASKAGRFKTGQLDVVKYLAEECKADVNARDEVNSAPHREQQAAGLVW